MVAWGASPRMTFLENRVRSEGPAETWNVQRLVGESHFWRTFSARRLFRSLTQGCALGYHISRLPRLDLYYKLRSTRMAFPGRRRKNDIKPMTTEQDAER